MMRIVYVNLHSNEKMVKILTKHVFKMSVSRKHRYILDEMLRQGITICNYITKGSGHHDRVADFIYRILYPLRIIESRILLRIDGLPTNKIKTIYRIRDIHDEDIVILYSIPDEYASLEKVNAFKACSLLHASCGSDFAKMYEKVNIQCFYNEADLRKNGEMFRRYNGSLNQPILVIPFVFAKRFQRKKNFEDRKNKAIAVGTIASRTDEEFLAVYGDSCMQPIRRKILNASTEMSAYYDCVSSEYGEGNERKIFRIEDNLLKKIYYTLWNLTHVGQQKSYFSFDMVEKFNQYKMAICGEEVIGVPGIGFVESMACGCAYIGCTKYDYASYGMVEGVHYIGYDGSMEDLIAKIIYYQNHTDELERIAESGYQFAQKNFIPEKVVKKLLEGLVAMKKEYERSNCHNIKGECNE